MYKTYNNLNIDNFPDDSELFLDLDTDIPDISLVDLALVEVKTLCRRIRLDRINTELIILHSKGFSDKRIAEGINSNYTRALCGKTLTEKAVSNRRYRAYQKMQYVAGENLGIITVLRQAFRRHL